MLLDVSYSASAATSTFGLHYIKNCELKHCTLYFCRLIFFLAFYPHRKNMQLSSRKVATQQDLKTSSGLKQKHPFRRGWNSSQSPTCLQPLHVFVYSHHGEETFCSQRCVAKPGLSSDAITKWPDSVPFQLNSLKCGINLINLFLTRWRSPCHSHEVDSILLHPASQQDSSQPQQLWLTNSASTCLHQRDATRRHKPRRRPKALTMLSNRRLANNRHPHSTFLWTTSQRRNCSSLPPAQRVSIIVNNVPWRKWILTHAAH